MEGSSLLSGLSVTTSRDGKSWDLPTTVSEGSCNYEVSLTTFRGELWALVVLGGSDADGRMFITKRQIDGTWMRPFVPVPDEFRAEGRAAFTSLDDRLYITYRGIGNNIYVIYTDNLTKFTDLGRVGGEIEGEKAKTLLDPLGESFAGLLWIFWVNEDHSIHWTTIHHEGEPMNAMPYTRIPGTKTRSPPGVCVHGSRLFLYEVAYDGGSFTWRYWYNGGYFMFAGWTKPVRVEALTISSSLSVIPFQFKQQLIAYRGQDNAIEVGILTDGTFFKFQGDATWEKGDTIAVGNKARSPPSVGYCGGLAFVCFGESKGRISYQSPSSMAEKSIALDKEDGDDQWECRWNQPQEKKSPKSFLETVFCL